MCACARVHTRRYIYVEERYIFYFFLRPTLLCGRNAIILIFVHRRNGWCSPSSPSVNTTNTPNFDKGEEIPFFVSISKDNGPAVSLCARFVMERSDCCGLLTNSVAREPMRGRIKNKFEGEAERKGYQSLSHTKNNERHI